MSKLNGTGLIRIMRAARCSWLGIRYAFVNESAFRQELLLSLLLIPLALWMTDNPVERLMLILPLLLLLAVECLNSAIEAVVDRIGTELHPLSGHAKDLGSAAVFFCLLMNLFSWLIIGLPKVL
ncbi:diacylglycerol kinase [Lacimicrobium alkaliphilum]|uniref:Diacylglycerol kinase n=1 Tax=Lacimicrobium alkaliphilum TaxID=1526571 RepID=A0A0U3AEU3_9ALTE|nr:diacylglycerol kinase [Lacimicrobium alkaliphilum]ALS97217.1 diacylglycerol kinase [Lacimicrobium alkaliphilum]